MIYLNDVPVHTTLFPDNTSQVWKVTNLEATGELTVRWEFSHEGEFMQLAQLRHLLSHSNVVLELPYLPYARQDKHVRNDSTFALRTFAAMLNRLNFKKVRILDAHSSVAFDLIREFETYYPVNEVRDSLACSNSDIMCYPDDGARVKYSDIYRGPYISAEKVRNPLNGAIISTLLNGVCNGMRVLIVDDICDGGATFVNLARLLYANGATGVSLFVTHGIFSKGLRPLRDAGITRIFTHKGEITAEVQRGL